MQAEERREIVHASTIEDTRPAIELPDCMNCSCLVRQCNPSCMNYRIGVTTTLLGTVMTVMGGALVSLIASALADRASRALLV